MWQRFTERARRVVFFAQEEAGRLGENYVSTEHLLLGLVRENDSVAAKILDRMGISLVRVRGEIERQVTRGDGKLSQDMQLTPRAKRVIDLAYDEARQLSNNYIGTEHLLLGLIREGEGLAGRVLAKLGVELERTRREVLAVQDNDTGANRGAAAASGGEAAAANAANAARAQTQFHAAFIALPAEQQAQMQAEGMALNQLPDAMQAAIRQMFDVPLPRGACVLDPNGLARVAVFRVEGATQYTVSARASFLASFLLLDKPAAPPAPEPAPAAEEAAPTAAETASEPDTSKEPATPSSNAPEESAAPVANDATNENNSDPKTEPPTSA